MADAGLAAENIEVLVEEEDNSVRRNADGSIEIDQPDGGVIIQFDPKDDDDEDGDGDVDLDKFYENLAIKMDNTRLLVIGNELCEAVQADDRSRANTLAIHARGLDLLGIELKDPSTSVGGDSSSAIDGMSTVTSPLLLEACLKGWANAQAELLPAEGPCKVDNVGLTPNQQKDDLADALELGMNTYLTDVAKEYVPDTSQMLLWGVYFRGAGFKKVFRCPLRRRPVSDSVSSQNLIVSDTTKDLAACARITHEIPMRTSVLKRMQLAGAYRDITLTQPTATSDAVDEKIANIQGTNPHNERPEDEPYTIWEIQCELDLPEYAPAKFKGKGIPLPYLVTLDKDTQEILAIRRDWRPEDEESERKRMYVKYPYVPGPGFYGTGLLNILGNSSAAMTAAWREALDAGMYASFPAFLIAKLAGRQNSSDFRAGPAQGIPIDTNGLPISDVVMGMPYKDVTAGLMAMIDKITSAAKEAGGSPDIPVGEGTANIPVGTMLSLIEQATKVMAAAHKGMHTAQSEELQMIADLFREDPEAFWRWNKKQRNYWDEQLLLTALNTYSLIPKSDPNIPSHIHRLQKAVALVQLCDSPSLGPLMNKEEALKRVLRSMKEDDNGLIAAPPAPSDPANDPKVIEAKAKDKAADGKILDAKAKMGSNEVRAADIAQRGAVAQEKLKTEGALKSVDMAQAILKTSAERRNADRSHGLETSKHNLNVGVAAHDAAIKTHEALKPEKPKA